MISEERKKALDIAMAQIEKNFGKGAVIVPLEARHNKNHGDGVKHQWQKQAVIEKDILLFSR